MNENKLITYVQGRAIGRAVVSEAEVERFWSKVNIGSPTDCWEWTGAKTGFGYGHMTVNGQKQVYAHRISYVIHHGSIPSGMHVCHSCDNPRCVNPSHLWVGTPQDNAIDRNTKGRHPVKVGSECSGAKLTESDAREIRRRASSKEWGIQTKLAKEYGVAKTTIRYIVIRRSWAHVK